VVVQDRKAGAKLFRTEGGSAPRSPKKKKSQGEKKTKKEPCQTKEKRRGRKIAGRRLGIQVVLNFHRWKVLWARR